MLLEAGAIRAIGVNCIPPALVAPALQVHLPSFPSAHLQEGASGSEYLIKTIQYLHCITFISSSKDRVFLRPKHPAYLS